MPRPPTDTSRRDCGRAAGGTGSSRPPAGSCADARSRGGLDERQRRDRRPEHLSAVIDVNGAARLEVLAPDIAERNGSAEGEGPHGRGDAADVLAFRNNPRPGGGNPIALEHQARETAIDVAAVLHARHDLLPDIAALGEAHEL